MRHHPSVRTSVATALVAVLTSCLAACSSAGSASAPSSASSGSSEAPLGERPLPSFLPSTSTPVDRVVTASPGHPQLAVQGIGVQVVAPSGQVLATVTGPKVPPFVAPPPPSVTAIFTVTLAQVTGTVPLRLADFTITDQLGRSFHPTLPVGEAPPPATLSAAHDLTFRVTAVMPTGEGRIYWAPAGGSPIVGWDFIVEND
ncbi:MAG: hypothetical protein ACTHMS_19645 [Jatrophihabitans sp.]|uniref:hypothetical protein n=1 Tax=Jatrophihabitans sp. TaxID=1932789 RepID=UPI003F7EBA47